MKIGVVVARFQVDELSKGHKYLLGVVRSHSDVVCVVLGYDENRGSKKNPLDLLTRKNMVEAYWREEDGPERLIILPKHNRPDDAVWSQELDKMLSETFPGHSITLYGGRDSFLARYSGGLPTFEVAGDPLVQSGTEIRKAISKQPGTTKEFRRGVIYGCSDQWPRVFPCVDIALFRPCAVGKLILGRRKGETLNRFFGGFVGQGEDLETAALRELKEEAGVAGHLLKYLHSFPVNDYRYRTPDDGQVLTSFFVCEAAPGVVPTAGDDIDSLVEVDTVKVGFDLIETMVPAHRTLAMYLLTNHLGMRARSGG